MSKVMKDGWHDISDRFRVLVEDGYFIRGVRYSPSPYGGRTVYPYGSETGCDCVANLSGKRRAYKDKICNYLWA